MTKVIIIFSCANDLHKIVIIRWRIGPRPIYDRTGPGSGVPRALDVRSRSRCGLGLATLDIDRYLQLKLNNEWLNPHCVSVSARGRTRRLVRIARSRAPSSPGGEADLALFEFGFAVGLAPAQPQVGVDEVGCERERDQDGKIVLLFRGGRKEEGRRTFELLRREAVVLEDERDACPKKTRALNHARAQRTRRM